MEKRHVEMTGEELKEAVELAEIIKYLATDVAQTKSEQVAIVSAQVARIRFGYSDSTSRPVCASICSRTRNRIRRIDCTRV